MATVGADQNRSPFVTCNVHVTTEQYLDAQPEGFRYSQIDWTSRMAVKPLDKDWLLGNWSDDI